MDFSIREMVEVQKEKTRYLNHAFSTPRIPDPDY